MTAAAATVPADVTAPARRASVTGTAPAVVRRVSWALLGLLVVQFLAVGLWQAKHDSLTVDEAVDVASGVTSVVRHDLRMNPEHGPLPKALAALPALLANPIVPESATYDSAAWFDYTEEFVEANRDAGRLGDIVFLSRIIPLLIGMGCGLLLFQLGRSLFGDTAGLVAAGLWLTTPVVVGLSHFAMIDVPFTFAVLLMCECLRRHVVRPSSRTLLALGGACAAALLTRHLAVALVGVLVLGLVVAGWRVDRRRALTSSAIVGLVAFVGVWVGIRVIAPTSLHGDARVLHEQIVEQASNDSLPAKIVATAPLPLEWQSGFSYLMITSDDRPAYLFGQAWEGSKLWFFPGSMVAKLPLGVLALVAAAPFAWRRLHSDRRRVATLVVGLPAGLTFGLVLMQPLNLGLRLVMPTVALLLLAASAVAVALRGRSRYSLGVVAVIQLGAFWQATPHSLAWTAPPFQPAYRWVSDSNVDFGQDADRLAAWVDDQVATGEAVWVSQVLPRGGENPAGSLPLVGTDPNEIRGWVAVGATSLTVVNRDELSWLRAYCPVDNIGGSVLIYRFDTAPSALSGPAMPAAPCSKGPSRR